MKSFWLFLTLLLTMLIWKPFSFYSSSQILSKKYWKFSDNNNFQRFFRSSKKNKFQFLDSGSRLAISVMNLSISIFSLFLKNIFENTSTNIFWRKYLTNIFRWKYFDKIFLVNKNYSTTIFWRKYFDKIFQTKIVRRNISDENISTIMFRWKYFDEIFQAKIFDDLFLKKIFDENFLAKIFRRKYYRSKYFWSSK